MISPKLIKEHNISLIMVTKSFLYTSLPTRFYLFRVIYFLYTKKPLNREKFFLITFLFMTSSSLLIAVESGKGDFIALIILSIVFQGTPMSLILLLNELFKKKQLYVISMRFLKIDIAIGIILLSLSILMMFIPFPVVNTDGLELIYLSINIIFCIYFLIRAYIKYHNTVHKPF